MRIDEIEISNYQGFRVSGAIKLDPGFNLVVGRNNTGKSALLRALSLRATGSPHISLASIPTRGMVVNPLSRLRVTLSALPEEVRNAVFAENRNIHLPAPAPLRTEDVRSAWEVLMAAPSVEFRCELQAGKNGGPSWLAVAFPAITAPKLFEHYQENAAISVVPDHEAGAIRFASGAFAVGSQGDSGVGLAQQIGTGVYHFTAERLNLARHAVGTTHVLAPNASNLAEVLSTLRSNPPRFEAYAKLVNEVFPSITTVTIKPQPNNQVEIMIWQTPPELEREDLAISLEDCGTGIGQVLAILYVVKTSDLPRTILIDEPNSFLHPGASRALVRILKRFGQHQYVIATHAPEVIGEVGPARIISLQARDGQTRVEVFDTPSVDVAGGILGDLGTRLSDVLGYERIIWVEGPSDADVFTLIARGIGISAYSTTFLPVRSTAAFEGTDVRDVLYLHRQLSAQRAPVPPAVRFIFDRDDKTDDDIRDLEKESRGALSFLRRRMLENYLLDVDAIAALLEHLDSKPPDPATTERVHQWITYHGKDNKYEANDEPIGSTNWFFAVHGAKLLADAIEELTESRHVYRKTSHAQWLAGWLLSNKPHLLADLETIVRDALAAD